MMMVIPYICWETREGQQGSVNARSLTEESELVLAPHTDLLN